MTKKRRNRCPEQIVRELAKADQLTGQGHSIDQIARELGVSQQTIYNWRKRYSGVSINEAKRLRELEDENAKLKRLVAEKELDILGLKEIAEG
ncbi:MAG: transposase, partial [Acidimicrobiales bacterium]